MGKALGRIYVHRNTTNTSANQMHPRADSLGPAVTRDALGEGVQQQQQF